MEVVNSLDNDSKDFNTLERVGNLESSGKIISIHNCGNLWTTLSKMAAKPEQNGKDDNVVLLMEIIGNKTAEQTEVKDTYSKGGSSKPGGHGGSQGR